MMIEYFTTSQPHHYAALWNSNVRELATIRDITILWLGVDSTPINDVMLEGEEVLQAGMTSCDVGVGVSKALWRHARHTGNCW